MNKNPDTHMSRNVPNQQSWGTCFCPHNFATDWVIIPALILHKLAKYRNLLYLNTKCQTTKTDVNAVWSRTNVHANFQFKRWRSRSPTRRQNHKEWCVTQVIRLRGDLVYHQWLIRLTNGRMAAYHICPLHQHNFSDPTKLLGKKAKLYMRCFGGKQELDVN